MSWVVFWTDSQFGRYTMNRYKLFHSEEEACYFAIDLYDHLIDCFILCLDDGYVKNDGIPSRMQGSTVIMWRGL